jgi:hypothetical protein
MRTVFIAAAFAAAAMPALPAMAQSQEYRRDVRDARQDYRENIRDADSRKDVRKAERRYQKDVRQANRDEWRNGARYDYNRPDPRFGGYYADRYYRDGSNYRPRRLSANDRIYRGSNGRYYCRRNDGTTGLIIGALGGGLLGNALDNGRSSTLGTLLGAGGGALLGRSVDRNNVQCR